MPVVISRKRKPPLILVMVAVLLVLLPLLAWRQYQWQGQVSEGLRNQMQTQMRRAASQFSDDFNREIRRIYTSFQPGPPNGAQPQDRRRQLRADYAELYANWNQSALYPKLVSDVFIVTRNDDGEQGIEHLNPSTGSFDAVEWPADLIPLRRPANIAVVRFGTNVDIPPMSLDRRIPAVIISILDSPLPTPGRRGLFEVPMSGTSTDVVVKLNLDYIRKEFLPVLAKQHFMNEDGTLAYTFAVVDPSVQRIVFPADTTFDKAPQGDITTEFFDGSSAGALIPSIGFAAKDIFETRGHTVVSGQSVFQLRVEKQTGLPQGMKDMVAGFTAAGSRPWQLVLTHQLGSLDAAVTQARNRNLAISFGILLLLGFSMAFILISVQRERRLAQQQMEFVSAVSHELRTPLAVICSAGENLADGVVQDEERARKYGALVRNEGRRLAEMVEQVLDFAGIQSGQKSYKLESTEVADIVDRALGMFEMQFRDNDIVVEKRIGLNIRPILSDQAALVRALQNLISNALKYADSGKWISVRAETATDAVRIIVEDHGGGISPVDLPHIFEPFYRGRAVVDAQIKGSGLGLSLVKQIVEAHKGKISVESDPTHGTLFIITLPLDGAVSNVVSSHDQAYSSR
jgi:signal transduction histidine kinase